MEFRGGEGFGGCEMIDSGKQHNVDVGKDTGGRAMGSDPRGDIGVFLFTGLVFWVLGNSPRKHQIGNTLWDCSQFTLLLQRLADRSDVFDGLED
jgi:hypothetical protein